MTDKTSFTYDLKKAKSLLSKLNTNSLLENFINEKDIYIDIRKNGSINIYHNGGSIFKITISEKEIVNAKINSAFLPNKYVNYTIKDDKIQSSDNKQVDLSNLFEEDKKKRLIDKIKESIKDYYPDINEKGIQGAYATAWKRGEGDKKGFFIDTELEYSSDENSDESSDGRIDLIYLDYYNPEEPKLYFVELKTIGDSRIFLWDKKTIGDKKNICYQLDKYKKFIKENKENLRNYYKELFKIKKEFNLIPEDAKSINIDNLDIELLPILLIGNIYTSYLKTEQPISEKEKQTIEEIFKDKIIDGNYKKYEEGEQKESLAFKIICRGINTNKLGFYSKNGKIKENSIISS